MFERLRAGFKAFGDTFTSYSPQGSGWGASPTAGYATSADWFFASWPSQECIVPNPGGCAPASSLVAAACNWLGTVLSASPIEVYQDSDQTGEYQIINDHPMSELTEEPNPYHSGELFWKTFAFYWITAGNVYFFKARNSTGQVIELWMLQSERVAVYSEAGKFISHYEYNPPGGGTMQRIEVEDMIHFRYSLNPRDHRLGISPLVSLTAEISTDIQGEMYSRTALSNAGVPPYIISPKLQGDNYIKFDADQMKASIENASGGFNRGKPLVISKPTDIKEFGFSPQQMDTKALRRIPEERISSNLGIPAIVLGYGVGLEHATYANYRTALRAGWDNCVIPTQKQIASTLRHQLLNEFEKNTKGFDVQFDNSEVDALKENINDQTAREIAMYVNGIKKLSEIRTVFDLDVTPDQEVFYVLPGNAAPPPSAPPVPGGMPPDTRTTLRGPHLTLPSPTVEKALGMHEHPTPAEQDQIEAWFNSVAPEDARGILSAKPV
jgi:HK97 family phage portal protein